jgi:hypothetical protein
VANLIVPVSHQDTPNALKTCSRCAKTKIQTDFHINKSKPDGLESRCKTCVSERKAEAYRKKRRLRLVRVRNSATVLNVLGFECTTRFTERPVSDEAWGYLVQAYLESHE